MRDLKNAKAGKKPLSPWPDFVVAKNRQYRFEAKEKNCSRGYLKARTIKNVPRRLKESAGVQRRGERGKVGRKAEKTALAVERRRRSGNFLNRVEKYSPQLPKRGKV